MFARMKSLNSENKIINLFQKIKEVFIVKLKMISIDHYFRLQQTPKNAKNIF
jgi:hypothetical protein